MKGMTGVAVRDAVNLSHSLLHCIAEPPTPWLVKYFQAGLFDDARVREARAAAEDQMQCCTKHGAQILTIWDDRYPALLARISYPPAVLYVHGGLQSADAIGIAIVGTRRNTQYGKLTTERFAERFANAGCVVVSGLATGIDTAAHQQTLRSGGTTYAVIASGLDCISPHYARNLAGEIAARGGAVVSEYPFGTKALPAYFPQRNRIISGISRAVVVVESGVKGGSLLTAQFAADESRDLYAVPGNITSEKSEGTNRLIQKQMAQPALSPEQVLADIGIAAAPRQTIVHTFSNSIEERIYSALTLEPQHADDIAEQLGININEVLVNLLMLEFRGIIRQLAGKQFVRL